MCVLDDPLRRDEYFKGDPSPTASESEGRGFGGLLGLGTGGDWQSGIFDFDSDDLFSPQTRSGLTPKKTSAAAGEGDKDREPLDVDFVSSSIGGHSEGAGGSANPPLGGSSYPFFPFGGGVFGSNFGFGNVFPFNFGNQNGFTAPWWKG